ncbi:ATP-dependent dethiobiotin synthetase BioD [Rosenbergiella sp. S61]|uniref:ATP-dependent dethiobiotin synthetase BioD n=1 Tax=Rosenbergiella gaditana TaxID=2726987 RepID=A0ABS5SX21_9GAMM|nr:dethiobiotin synthase [Rosenbergiella gaditana]MBT0724482.1 ATP-dependent dethiobiotin synthetase BioD [Rosenbergiella gaditana]
MSHTYFLTGTDTDVGKTLVSAALLQAAGRAGFSTAGYKPVASGSEWTAEGLRNRDALVLQRYSNVDLPYTSVNPLTFEQPTSPHIASQREGKPISFPLLDAGLAHLQTQADWVLVEGAGGWFTPLTEQQDYGEWVIAQQLSVILVVGMKLGCINHALLTQAAIQQAGLDLVGWVANSLSPEPHEYAAYCTYLTKHIKAPLLGEIPFLSDAEPLDEVGQYLTLP